MKKQSGIPPGQFPSKIQISVEVINLRKNVKIETDVYCSVQIFYAFLISMHNPFVGGGGGET